MDGYDGTTTAGRKGIAYDWRAVLAANEFAGADELPAWLDDDAIARFVDGAVTR